MRNLWAARRTHFREIRVAKFSRSTFVERFFNQRFRAKAATSAIVDLRQGKLSPVVRPSDLNPGFEGGFDVRRSRDPETLKMTEPNGAFFVAMSDNLPIGCGALCGDGSQVAEVKRVWIHPAARGFGFATRLMRAIENKALELSIRELRLDTNRALTEAITFYHQAGWRGIERSNDDPYADYFFSKIVGA